MEHGEFTRLLAQLDHGGRDALDRLLPLVYDELQRVARHRLRHERAGHTLATTDLVHEAYLKLVRLDHIEWKNRAQFYALAAQAMRRVLIDHAVRRQAQKRGGHRRPISLDEAGLRVETGEDTLLELDQALQRLAAQNPRHGRVVECRYFAGMSIEETADALGVSPATVKRDWTFARAWLHRELSP